MDDAIEATISFIDSLFRNSPVMCDLGYQERILETTGPDVLYPATCCLSFKPTPQRQIRVNFCYSHRGHHFFGVEIVNSEARKSVLLEELIQEFNGSLEPYPFVLASYPGTVPDKLIGFLQFLEYHFGSAHLTSILKGREWIDIPYNWGCDK